MIYRNDSIEAIIAMEIAATGNYGEPEGEALSFCDSCGGEIYSGEDFLDCEGGIFCRRCVSAMTSEDVVEILGFKFKQMQKGRD